MTKAMVMSINDLRKKLTNDPKVDENLIWYKIFGDKDLFNKSIMSSKPRITNSWNLIQYTEYVNKFVIPSLKDLDDWCNSKKMYSDYQKKLPTIHGSMSSDDPMVDHMGLINYEEFCSDISDVYIQVKDDLIDFGVPEIQASIGSMNNMYWILRNFRSHYYQTLYSLENDESKESYQQSPLRWMLLFLINKRLDRLIPDSETFKFGQTYFSAKPYLIEVSNHVQEFLLDKYSSDMFACKLIA